MAIARCEACGQPKGMKRDYPHPHTVILETPSRHTRIVCGAVNCTRDALIWLKDAEEAEYVVACAAFEFYNIAKCR